ncbi:MAG: acryloyl-CoA reductase [Gammaproteobacteria bacterium]|nr:MAG: acryloyl-CoA reductase [Gammaproteobacteria bacterium]
MMNESLRALRAERVDGKVRSTLQQLKVSDLSPGEVLIRVAWSSVNYKDALAATGAGRIITRFPCIPGIDLSGRVIHSDDPRFSEGDEVLVTGYELGTGHDGGYAEIARVPADWVVPLPEGLDLYEAMALGTAGFTVALCVRRLEDNHQRPDAGPFLVTGATGGVGSIAVDVLSSLGYQVTALTGKKEAHDWLRELGAAQVLDRHELEYGQAPLEKGRWAGAIDNVGGELLSWITRTTRPWGNVVSVGLAGGSQLNTTVMPFILRGVALLGVTSSGCPAQWRRELWQRLASDLKPRHLRSIAATEVGLEELPGVFERILAGKVRGRVVVRIGGEKV